MKSSKELIQELAPKGAPYFSELDSTMEKYNITNPQRVCFFLANVLHETIYFRRLVESFRFSPTRLMDLWPRRFPTLELATKASKDPVLLGDLIYGGRMGNDKPGDGYRYRGRGGLMTTGKAMYDEVGKHLGLDLRSHPELLEQAKWACNSAGFYWNKRRVNQLCDKGDFKGVCRAVNGGYIGLNERTVLYKKLIGKYQA